jgi:hypothetical protein
MRGGDRLEGRLEGDRVVGGAQRIGVLEVDLVLAGGHLVVRCLHLDAELLEPVHHLLADLGAEVLGKIEVPSRVVRQRLNRPVLPAQQEELELRTGVEREAEVARPLQLPLQHAARIAGEGIAVRRVDVADDARRTGAQLGAVGADARLPRDGAERAEIRLQEHVGFGDPREALDRAAVEPLAVLDGLFQLVHRHLHRFHAADDVGELQADEAQVALLGGLHDGGEVSAGHGAADSCAASIDGEGRSSG